MIEKILLIDDEPDILKAFSMRLKGQYDIYTADSGPKGLDLIQEQGPFAVVLSDYNMPEMDGVTFLSKVQTINPDTVRIMITGCADLNMAIAAVNEGRIFRFITKPCKSEYLIDVIHEGVKQFNLLLAEKELQENTLKGAIGVLSDLLSMLSPEDYGWTSQITRYVKGVAALMDAEDQWRIETAALLSQVGAVVSFRDLVHLRRSGAVMSKEETALFLEHPEITANLIRRIPRMDEIAEIIQYQEKHFDGSGVPEDQVKGEQIPLGARILKPVLDFDALENSGLSKVTALGLLKQETGKYDPAVLDAFELALDSEEHYHMDSVEIENLAIRMILAEDVKSVDGTLLVSRGHEVSISTIQNLKQFARVSGVQEPLQVLIPRKKEVAVAKPR